MAPRAKPIFNPKTFLAKVGKGKTHTDYPKNRKVFSQGDAAEAIFHIRKGKVKLTVVSKQGNPGWRSTATGSNAVASEMQHA
jgi:CRP-like cAMP-binding protein